MDANPTRAALDKFGRLLVERVREGAINDWTKILQGRMKGATADRLRNELAGLPPDAVAGMQRLVPEIVDTTLHHLLWMLEQEEGVELAVMTSLGEVSSLRDGSDGLAGELYGWIPRFSRQDAG